MGLASQALADKSQRWWHLASIQLAGGLISVPVIAMGSEIFLADGLASALTSILIGNLIILLLSYFIVYNSHKNRLNAVENASQFLGKIGGKVLAVFILLTGISWVAWELHMGVELLQLHHIFSEFSIGSIIGAIAALTLLIGIKGLKTLCLIAVVPLSVGLFYLSSVEFLPILDIGFSAEKSFFSIMGISLVLSSSTAAIIEYPTFFRHSRSRKDTIFAIIMIFIATTCLQICGILLFHTVLEEGAIFSKMLYLGGINSQITVGFLIISMLTSVAWNIYAVSVGWESLFPIFKDRTEYAVIGLVMITIFTNQQIEQFFSSNTLFFDVVMCGLTGIIFYSSIQHMIMRRKNQNHNDVLANNLSWFLSTLLGFLVYFNVFMSIKQTVFFSLLFGFSICFSINSLRLCFPTSLKLK